MRVVTWPFEPMLFLVGAGLRAVEHRESPSCASSASTWSGARRWSIFLLVFFAAGVATGPARASCRRCSASDARSAGCAASCRVMRGSAGADGARPIPPSPVAVAGRLRAGFIGRCCAVRAAGARPCWSSRPGGCWRSRCSSVWAGSRRASTSADARAAARAATLPDAYFRGLNFLLNEQPDKAIDAFIDVVRLDPETIELHFALGNLFRRRGETDRAIRVHLNLAERA